MTKILCKDCKYFVLNNAWSTPYFQKKYAICGLVDLVTGEAGDIECRTERHKMWPHCGKKARYWEAKS